MNNPKASWPTDPATLKAYCAADCAVADGVAGYHLIARKPERDRT